MNKLKNLLNIPEISDEFLTSSSPYIRYTSKKGREYVFQIEDANQLTSIPRRDMKSYQDLAKDKSFMKSIIREFTDLTHQLHGGFITAHFFKEDQLKIENNQFVVCRPHGYMDNFQIDHYLLEQELLNGLLEYLCDKVYYSNKKITSLDLKDFDLIFDDPDSPIQEATNVIKKLDDILGTSFKEKFLDNLNKHHSNYNIIQLRKFFLTLCADISAQLKSQ